MGILLARILLDLNARNTIYSGKENLKERITGVV
jgi:hypothetical protein